MKTDNKRCWDADDQPRDSLHLRKRIRQRGITSKDLSLVRMAGEEFDDGYLMSRRAIGERVAYLKAEIQRLERLNDLVLIEQSDTLVTAYRACSGRRKRILREGRSRL